MIVGKKLNKQVYFSKLEDKCGYDQVLVHRVS